MADPDLPQEARKAAEAAYRNWRIGDDGEGRLHAALVAYERERDGGTAAAELEALKAIHDRTWRPLWVLVRQSGGSVFIPEGELAGIPPLASLGTDVEPGGMRVNAAEEA